MTKSLILSLAAAATFAATTSFGPAAEAGGVRLGFGFPLGSFTAQPTHGYGGSSYGAEKHCVKRAPSYVSSARPSTKFARTKTERSETRVATYSKPKQTTTTSAPIVTAAKSEGTAASPATTGSTALAAGTATYPATTTLAAVTETETINAIPAPAATTAGTVGENNQPVAATEETVIAAANTGCKKFIPAVGVTISIDCPK